MAEPIVNDVMGIIARRATIDADDGACYGGGKVAGKRAVGLAEPGNDGVETGKVIGKGGGQFTRRLGKEQMQRGGVDIGGGSNGQMADTFLCG